MGQIRESRDRHRNAKGLRADDAAVLSKVSEDNGVASKIKGRFAKVTQLNLNVEKQPKLGAPQKRHCNRRETSFWTASVLMLSKNLKSRSEFSPGVLKKNTQ